MNNPTATQIICNLINNIMDEAEPNALTRRVFEYQLVNACSFTAAIITSASIVFF